MTAFNADGMPDTAFGGGSATIDSGVSGIPAAIATDAAGNILLAGSSPDARNPASNDAVLARFTSGGVGVNVASALRRATPASASSPRTA